MNNEFYKISMITKKEKQVAKLDLFGVIGGGFWEEGFDESSFKRDLAQIPAGAKLEIHINSPGGSVFVGMAIKNLIQTYAGEVEIFVMGIAASAATLITCAKNAKVYMPTGSMLMVHPPRLSGYKSMTAEELKEAAEALEKTSVSILEVYKEKTKLQEKKILELMNKETYLTAAEAVEYGFADEEDKTIKIENRIDDAGGLIINGLAVSPYISKEILESLNAAKFSFEEKDTEPAAQETKGLDGAKENFDLSNENKKDLQTNEEKFNLPIANATEKNIFNENNGGHKPMTKEEMREQFPEIYNAILNDGVKQGIEQERARIKEIEDLAVPGNEAIVNDAKFVSGMTAEKMAVAILKANKEAAAVMLKDRQNDAADLSDVLNTPGVDPIQDKKTPEEIKNEKQEAEFMSAFKKGGN